MKYKFNEDRFQKQLKFIDKIKKGFLPDVEFTSEVFSEMFIEPNMRATLSKVEFAAEDGKDLVYEFTFNLSKFEKFNMDFETYNWIGDNNQDGLSAREANAYPKDNIETHFYSLSFQDLPFTILETDNKKVYDMYENSKSKLSYTKWLEEELLKNIREN